jgi:hypothetical protein
MDAKVCLPDLIDQNSTAFVIDRGSEVCREAGGADKSWW